MTISAKDLSYARAQAAAIDIDIAEENVRSLIADRRSAAGNPPNVDLSGIFRIMLHDAQHGRDISTYAGEIDEEISDQIS